MTKRPTKYVTYYRVSTERQGRSGLGLGAQRSAVEAFMAANGPRSELASFTEVESGKHADRPELAKALLRCRQTQATLLVAKLDRLSRDAAFLLTLQNGAVKFVAADMPEANEAMIGFMAVMAQYERKMISTRTRAALAAAKARGQILGNPNLSPGNKQTAAHANAANVARAVAHASDLRDVIADARSQGSTTLQAIAAHLASLGITTSRGAAWTPTAVRRVLARLDVEQHAN
jgi:DNA invertase Pin-like site-specific DNA recombinase